MKQELKDLAKSKGYTLLELSNDELDNYILQAWLRTKRIFVWVEIESPADFVPNVMFHYGNDNTDTYQHGFNWCNTFEQALEIALLEGLKHIQL